MVSETHRTSQCNQSHQWKLEPGTDLNLFTVAQCYMSLPLTWNSTEENWSSLQTVDFYFLKRLCFIRTLRHIAMSVIQAKIRTDSLKSVSQVWNLFKVCGLQPGNIYSARNFSTETYWKIVSGNYFGKKSIQIFRKNMELEHFGLAFKDSMKLIFLIGFYTFRTESGYD